MIDFAPPAFALQSRQQKEDDLSSQVYNAQAASKPTPQWNATMVRGDV
jgi:hypothetical protein